MFVAVWPDDPTIRRLSALELGSAAGLTAVRPGQWHVTVRFLGDVEDHLLPTLTEALERAATTVPGPVHCTIGPATAWFSGGRVLQIPATGLEDVAQTVRQATLPLIPDAGEAPFIGHLTIGSGRAGADAGPTRPRWRPWPDWPSRRSSMCGTSCSSPQRCRPGVPTTRRWRSSHFPHDRKEAPGDRWCGADGPVGEPAARCAG